MKKDLDYWIIKAMEIAKEPGMDGYTSSDAFIDYREIMIEAIKEEEPDLWKKYAKRGKQLHNDYQAKLEKLKDIEYWTLYAIANYEPSEYTRALAQITIDDYVEDHKVALKEMRVVWADLFRHYKDLAEFLMEKYKSGHKVEDRGAIKLSTTVNNRS